MAAKAQFLATVKVGADNLMFSLYEHSTLHDIFDRISQSWPFITPSSHTIKHKMPGEICALNRLIDDAAVKDVMKLHTLMSSFLIELVVEDNHNSIVTPVNKLSARVRY